MLQVDVFLKITCFLIILTSFGACRSGSASNRSQAEIDAKRLMLNTQNTIANHIEINNSEIFISHVVSNADGGWDITLKARGCVYVVYAKPGTEEDVEGIGAGCLKKDKDGNRGHPPFPSLTPDP